MKPALAIWQNSFLINLFSDKKAVVFFTCIFFSLHSTLLAQHALKSRTSYSGYDYNNLFSTPDMQFQVLASDLGYSFKSIDFGRSWSVIKFPTNSYIQKTIFKPDKINGFAISGTSIYQTKDGGLSWTSENITTEKAIVDFAFTKDFRNGIAVTEDRNIYVTKNDGKDWQITSSLQYYLDLTGCKIINNSFYVYGEGTAIFKTELSRLDKDWDDLVDTTINTAVDRNSIYCVTSSDDGKIVWAGCGGGFVINSKDYGKSWSSFKLSTNARITSIAYSLTQKGWLCTNYGEIFKLGDDGKWKIAYVDNNHAWLNDIKISKDERTIIAVGRSSTKILSDDGGLTWSSRAKPYYDIHEIFTSDDGKNFYLASDSGHLLVSIDEGNNWNRVTPIDFKTSLFGIEYVKANNRIFAVGTERTIVSINYNGNDFVIHKRDNSHGKFNSIYFDSVSNNLITVGSNCEIFLSSDLGKNWKSVGPQNDKRTFSDICRLEKKLVAVGSSGCIYTSEDNGNNWVTMPFYDSTQNFINVYYNNRTNVGYLTSASKKIDRHLFKFSKSNESWLAVGSMPENSGLTHINCNSSNGELVICSSNGDVYKSVGNDSNWFKVEPRILGRSLNFTQFDKYGNTYFAGGLGSFYKYPINDQLYLSAKIEDRLSNYRLVVKTESPQKDTAFGKIKVEIIGEDLIDGVDPKYKSIIYERSKIDSIQPYPHQIFKPNTKYIFRITFFDGWNSKTIEVPFVNGKLLLSRIASYMHWNKPIELNELDEIIVRNSALIAFLYAFVIILLFIFKTSVFVKWHELVASSRFPYPDKLAKFLVLNLITSKKSLDVFVKKNKNKLIEHFNEYTDVNTRPIWIPAPFEANQEKTLTFSNVSNEENYIAGLSEIKKKINKHDGSILCISIEGQGGIGKSSLAFQIARWGYSMNKSQRIMKHQVIPIFINKIDKDLKLLVDEKLRYILGLEFISNELLTALLRNKRLLIIVDGLSELNLESTDFINPERGGKDCFFCVYTSRKPNPFATEIRILPFGLSLSFLDPLLDSFTNSYVGAFRFGGQREILRNKIIEIVTKFNAHQDSDFIPLGILRLLVVKAAKILDDNYSLKEKFPSSIGSLLEDYILELFRTSNFPGEDIKNLRNIALECLGLSENCKFKSDDLNTVLKPTWIPQTILTKKYDNSVLANFIVSGILITSGAIDDLYIKFTFDTICEYLGSKEIAIRYRDHIIEKEFFLKLVLISSKNNVNIKKFISELTKNTN